MAIKKSELYSSLWKSCDELRGGMDASQYKDYVLVLLFVKYVSDKYAGQKNALIEVPPNLFYGTSVPACIIFLNKEEADIRESVFMIDASKRFIKEGNKNRLRSQDIHRIVDTFNKQHEISKYSRFIPFSEIEANDYNLNISRYIDNTEAEDLQNIEGHLCGGIPDFDIENLNSYWQVFPNLRSTLFQVANRKGYNNLCISPNKVKSNIINLAEFKTFMQEVNQLFSEWLKQVHSTLMRIQIGDNPKQLIEEISESLLEVFRQAQLINHYDVYQHLMNYWSETMQDDVYMLISEGWHKANTLREIVNSKENKENTNLIIGKKKYKAELIPPDLIISRYFAFGRESIIEFEKKVDAVHRKIEEHEEEHCGEEDLLNDAKNDKDKLTKGSVKSRLSQIKHAPGLSKERELLQKYLSLLDKESEANKKLKDAQSNLNQQIFEKYLKLTEEEIKVLVVDDKWLSTLQTNIQGEFDRVSQRFTGRVKELAERYATPLPAIEQEVEECQKRVEAHLKKMGFEWGFTTTKGGV